MVLDLVLALALDLVLSLLVCSSLGMVGVALLLLLSLFVGFAFNDRFVIVDVENQVTLSGWKDWEAGELRGAWR